MQIQGVDIDSLPMTVNYNGDGTVNYFQVVIPANPGTSTGGTFRQTLTYTNGQVTAFSDWIKQ